MGFNNKRKKQAEKLLKQMPTNFVEVNLSIAKQVPKWCTRAYYNNKYFITINDNALTNKGKAIRVMVQKHSDTPILNHWFEMQKIKNEIFGQETIAVEYYPKVSDLIDQHNIYWLWIFNNNELPIPINLDYHV